MINCILLTSLVHSSTSSFSLLFFFDCMLNLFYAIFSLSVSSFPSLSPFFSLPFFPYVSSSSLPSPYFTPSPLPLLPLSFYLSLSPLLLPLIPFLTSSLYSSHLSLSTSPSSSHFPSSLPSLSSSFSLPTSLPLLLLFPLHHYFSSLIFFLSLLLLLSLSTSLLFTSLTTSPLHITQLPLFFMLIFRFPSV